VSKCLKSSDDYWRELWRWYENGGFEHVAAYLNEYDLTGFDPKAPPPLTHLNLITPALVSANTAAIAIPSG
jgi:hypothetical protein